MKKRFMCVILALGLLVLMLCGCDGSQSVSDSDASGVIEKPVVWELAENDDEYMEMMRLKLNEYINCMTAVSSMERRLSVIESAEKIAADEEFAAVTGQLYDWCEGALGYPAENLSSADAKTVCQQMCELAGATTVYLDNLPAMLDGTYTGELSAADYQNSIVDNALAIYELLN